MCWAIWTYCSDVSAIQLVSPKVVRMDADNLPVRVGQRSVTTGTRVRQIPRDDAEIAIECLRDWGFSARIVEPTPHDPGEPPADLKRAA